MRKFILFLSFFASSMLIGSSAQAQITGDQCVAMSMQEPTVTRNYSAPASICNSGVWAFSFESAPVGNGSSFVNQKKNNCTVSWFTPGKYVLKASINCGAWTDVYYTTVIVTRGNEFASIQLTNLNDCAYPYTSFLINNNIPINPIASYALQITQVDANNNPTGAYNWSNSPIYPASCIMPSTNYTSSATGFNLQSGKRYRIRLNVTIPYCATASSLYSDTYIDIKATSTVAPVINVNGSTAAPVNVYPFDPTFAILVNNTNTTSNSACGKINMEITRLSAANNTTDCSSSGPPTTLTDIPNAAVYNLRTLYPTIAEGGWFKIRIQNANNGGTGAWSNSVCVLAIKSIVPTFKVRKLTYTPPVPPSVVATKSYLDQTGSIISASPTLMGAQTAQINYITIPNAGGYSLTKYRLKVYELTGGGLETEIGGQESSIPTGFNAIMLQDVPIYGVCTGCPPAYADGYFATNYNNTAVTNKTYKVALAVGMTINGVDVWTPDADRNFAYFKIQASCKTCRIINGVETADEAVNLFEISPNPTTNELFVDIVGSNAQNLSVTDVSGKLITTVQDAKLNTEGKQRLNVDVSHLAAGIYFCVLRNNQGVVTRKFVKQ
jgi:hypothetical protein